MRQRIIFILIGVAITSCIFLTTIGVLHIMNKPARGMYEKVVVADDDSLCKSFALFKCVDRTLRRDKCVLVDNVTKCVDVPQWYARADKKEKKMEDDDGNPYILIFAAMALFWSAIAASRD
ncbi:MAG: hypothetical protein GXO39_04365 [Thermotogae bacterium]|nr:hypothetical protein [Thermotogota bacterium]